MLSQYCLRKSVVKFLFYQQVLFSKAMPRGVKKENLPIKVCLICDRPFTWRKKWERCWDEVTTCSKSCNARRRAGSRVAGMNIATDDDGIDDADSENEASARVMVRQDPNDLSTSRVANSENVAESMGRESETFETQEIKGLVETDSASVAESSTISSIHVSSEPLLLVPRGSMKRMELPNKAESSLISLPPTSTENRQDGRRKKREKLCEVCNEQKDHLFRCQWDDSKKWRFVCKPCWPIVSGSKSSKEPLYNKDGTTKPPNPLYVYGGTWKA
jgi:hypothetical protein